MAKQIILDILNHKKTDRVPVGMWWHYTDPSEWGDKPGDEKRFERVFQGHLKYAKEAGLDLLKVMPDVYFVLPNLAGVDILDEEQLKAVKPAAEDDLFFEEYVRLVKKLSESLGEETAVFPTVFSPYYYLLYTQLGTTGKAYTEVELGQAVKKHPEAVKHAVDVIAQDLIRLSRRFLTEAGSNGYLLCGT